MKTKKLAPIHPGEILREDFMKPRDLSQNALVRALNVPPRRVNEIVLEKRSITADTRRDGGQPLLTIGDRRAAIAKAIELAAPGDLVLVAGKGHEKYQVIGDQVLPFDDVAVAREALARRRTNSGVL